MVLQGILRYLLCYVPAEASETNEAFKARIEKAMRRERVINLYTSPGISATAHVTHVEGGMKSRLCELCSFASVWFHHPLCICFLFSLALLLI